MEKYWTLALLFLFLLPLVSAGKVNLFNYLPANERVKLVTFECHSNCTPEKWFMVNNLTIIKTYNGTHDLKVMITGNKSRREFIPAKNLPSFTISDINWSSVNETIKNITSYKFLGSTLPKHYSRMRGKITRNGLKMEFHCDECLLSECPLFLDITCEDNCKVEPKTFADCGMDMKYTETGSTTSKTTTASSGTKTTTSSTKERKLCGPALIVGLALVPLLVRRRRG